MPAGRGSCLLVRWTTSMGMRKESEAEAKAQSVKSCHANRGSKFDPQSSYIYGDRVSL